nr:hypothetical protein [Nocardioides convexus]
MPHKQNPVLSILVRSAALQAPLLQAQPAVSPPGRPPTSGPTVPGTASGPHWCVSWTSRWSPPRRRPSLVAGLQVDAGAMARRVDAASADLLAERGGGGAPRDYLGVADAFVDTVLARVRRG